MASCLYGKLAPSTFLHLPSSNQNSAQAAPLQKPKQKPPNIAPQHPQIRHHSTPSTPKTSLLRRAWTPNSCRIFSPKVNWKKEIHWGAVLCSKCLNVILWQKIYVYIYIIYLYSLFKKLKQVCNSDFPQVSRPKAPTRRVRSSGCKLCDLFECFFLGDLKNKISKNVLKREIETCFFAKVAPQHLDSMNHKSYESIWISKMSFKKTPCCSKEVWFLFLCKTKFFFPTFLSFVSLFSLGCPWNGMTKPPVTLLGHVAWKRRNAKGFKGWGKKKKTDMQKTTSKKILKTSKQK